MNENHDSPPENSLAIIRKHCNHAMELYLYLWKRKNHRNVLTIDADDVVFISSEESFKEDMRKLQVEHVISYIKMKNEYIIKVLE